MDENLHFQNVLKNNTFFFHNDSFEELWESEMSYLVQNLISLKSRVDALGLTKQTLIAYLVDKEDGIEAIMAITGISKETLLRIITFIRVFEGNEFIDKAFLKHKWSIDYTFKNDEWHIDKIKKLILNDEHFREGIANLFIDGSTLEPLKKALPLFEYKKLDLNKMSFNLESMLDTIVRYKSKGSYYAQKNNNPDTILEQILHDIGVKYSKGKIASINRNMSFIIPNKSDPRIIIGSCYSTTTASGMGDKANTSIVVGEEIKKYLPKAKFFGFVDGIGWYVRQWDLVRMVSAFDDVFTFKESEIKRFKSTVLNIMSK